MLKIMYTLSDLKFGKLMSVYEESNRENSLELYSGLENNIALINVEQDFYAYLRDVFFTTMGAFYAVWEEKGEYVSALRMEPYCDGLLLEALETAPNCRRKGFAKALINAVLERLKHRGGFKVYSHIGKCNSASLSVHKECGFCQIKEHAVYIDGSVRNDACTLCFDYK